MFVCVYVGQMVGIEWWKLDEIYHLMMIKMKEALSAKLQLKKSPYIYSNEWSIAKLHKFFQA